MKCQFCGKEFKPKLKTHINCSEACRRKKHYYNNPELHKEKRLAANSDVPRRIISRIKCRAKAKGIPFNLDVSDIIIPDTCPVLGIPIYSVAGKGTNQHNSPSVDRIDPSKGYVKGNVRIISNRANLLKSNATVEELTLVLEDLKCL